MQLGHSTGRSENNASEKEVVNVYGYARADNSIILFYRPRPQTVEEDSSIF
jgi:hypothetical protein